MDSYSLGQQGELFAREFLVEQGYRILETNFRTKFGEIDIVAKDKDTVCFIEVKTRVEDGWDAFEAVHRGKQKKMIRVAQQYLLDNHGTVDVASRFDVLAVFQGPNGAFKGDLVRDAFQC